jgi:hypothetical protein
MNVAFLISLGAALLGAIILFAYSSSLSDQPILLSLRRNLDEASNIRRTISRSTYELPHSPTSPVAPARPSTRSPVAKAPIPIPVTKAPVAHPITKAPVRSPATNAPILAHPTPTNAPPAASLPLPYSGNNGYPSSAFPLGKCHGDCDNDKECAYGLTCFQRTYAPAVPGCSGTPQASYDYCIDPVDLAQNGTILVQATGEFELKMYWQTGYLWQGENFDRKWCMKCDDTTPECHAGQNVYVTQCVTNSTSDEPTNWQFVYLPSGAFYIKISSSDLCLTLPTDTKNPLDVEVCNSYNERQLFFTANGQAIWGSHFELHPATAYNKCLDITHHPKFGERIFAWPCSYLKYWTTGLWNFVNGSSSI